MKAMEPAAGIAQLLALDWDFVDADTAEGGHDLVPYPCKFPPQIPTRLIETLTSPGDMVLDCFGGSGTTAVEAIRLARQAVSLDANPLAALVTRAKACPPSDQARMAVRAWVHEPGLVPVCVGDCTALAAAPDFANRDKWYAEVTFHELAHIRAAVDGLAGEVRELAEIALAQTAAKVSFQESETRYVSKKRGVVAGEAPRVLIREVERLLSRLGSPRSQSGVIVAVGDARAREDWPVADGLVALVCTSPPYPNAYDYHLYQRFRLLWMRSDPSALRRVEIGSHLRQQAVADPVTDYENDLAQVLRNAWLVLRAGGICAFVVGDGLYNKAIYSTSARLVSMAQNTGFTFAGEITRKLPQHKRAVTSAGRRLRQEQIVLLTKPRIERRPPTYPLFPYEDELASREFASLMATRPSELGRLAFTGAVVADGDERLTWQALLEAEPGVSHRKNSTYATHGIHKYKGKFYPQLAKCLLNLSNLDDGLVVDPFAGSGTVALEASLLGLPSRAIELNPVGAAIARAKSDALRLPSPVLRAATEKLLRRLGQTKAKSIRWVEFEDATHAELESWFSPLVLARLSQTLASVRGLREELPAPHGDIVVRLAEVLISDLVRGVSHQDPADLRIRRRTDPPTDAPMPELLANRWGEVATKLAHVAKCRAEGLPAPGQVQVVTGDSADPLVWPDQGSVSVVVTSPPYAAALPYIDTSRLSLAAIFGWDKKARVHLEDALVGSREIGDKGALNWLDRLRRGDLSAHLPASTSMFLTLLAEAVEGDSAAGFRRRQTPGVLTRYFTGMSDVLQNAAGALRPSGEAWLVMGDSTTTVAGRQWLIPTTEEVAAIAKHHGLELVETIPITVTRENMRHAKNAITRNTLLHFIK